jgi:hypothetical protein
VDAAQWIAIFCDQFREFRPQLARRFARWVRRQRSPTFVASFSSYRWHGEHVTELRACRRQLAQSQAEFARTLGVALNSLRMWDSGVRPTPPALLERAPNCGCKRRSRSSAAEPAQSRLRIERACPDPASGGADRTARSSVFNALSIRPTAPHLGTRRRQCISSQVLQAIQRSPPGPFTLPSTVPTDCDRQIRKLRLELQLSDGSSGTRGGGRTRRSCTSGSRESECRHLSSGSV